MKKIILMAGLVLTAGFAMAQTPELGKRQHKGKPAMHNRQGGDRGAMKDLNLTEEQQKQMRALNEKFRNDMRALQRNENISVKEQRDQREALTRQHREAVQQVLTPQQREQLAAHRTEQANRGKVMREKHNEQLAEKLKLTDQQRAEWKRLQDAHQKEMQQLRQNESLDRVAKREQSEKLMHQHREALRNLLTDEQKAQWKEEGPARRPAHPRGVPRGPKKNITR